MEQFDLVIIGGGISGLSLAQFITSSRPGGMRVAVLEKDAHPGGAIQTIRLERDFWLELGTHTAYNSYGRMLDLMEAGGVMEQLLGRNKVPWLFWEDGVTRKVTAKLHWLELAANIPRLFFTKKDGLSVEQYFSRVLGKRNFSQVLGPMVGAVTSQDARDFPAAMLFKKRPRRKDVRRSFTLEGGLQTATDAMAAASGVSFFPNCEVREIIRKGAAFHVTTTGGTYSAPTLGLATQPTAGAELMKNIFPEVAQALAKIGQTEVETVGVVVPRAETELPALAGLVSPGGGFYSVVSRDTVDHPDYRGFAFHFRPGLTDGAKDEQIAAVLGVSKNKWEHRTAKANPLPTPVMGHPALLAELERAIEGQSLLVTGNYFEGLALEDCVGRSAHQAARFFSQEPS